MVIKFIRRISKTLLGFIDLYKVDDEYVVIKSYETIRTIYTSGAEDMHMEKCVLRHLSLQDKSHHGLMRIHPLNSVLQKSRLKYDSYIALPYAPYGDLYNKLSSSEGISKSVAIYYFKQILDAVIHLHKIGYSHLDISLENIFLFDSFPVSDKKEIRKDLSFTETDLKFLKMRPVVSDFGMVLKYDRSGGLYKIYQKRGKASYVCPEINELKLFRPEKADSYSLGGWFFLH